MTCEYCLLEKRTYLVRGIAYLCVDCLEQFYLQQYKKDLQKHYYKPEQINDILFGFELGFFAAKYLFESDNLNFIQNILRRNNEHC